MIVAGFRNQLGASNRILTLVAERRLVPLVTTALFLEYEDVLNRPQQRLATGMAKEDALGFLADLASAAEPVDVHFMWRPQLADPADELVLEAAVNEGIGRHAIAGLETRLACHEEDADRDAGAGMGRGGCEYQSE